ncbi:hypothetical protein E4K64_33415 [Bradyrhizobium frederickii]|uniref:Uncharacterized protein n=1 Tax=Bradyrhizobium frederickii TaxID=2560054 RepID=A0A4Y9NQ24_9BRAD|nr:hypothetical protein [Bradyrhizobium frederickii]TFV69432.1 hypothetical protein E4K64_33415 [Bradyrhizobium frederickii]
MLLLICLKIHPLSGRFGALERLLSRRVVRASIRLLVGRPMDTVIAYAISAFIVGFGIGIFIAGLNSDAPALWACVALIPIAIGLLSVFGPK